MSVASSLAITRLRTLTAAVLSAGALAGIAVEARAQEATGAFLDEVVVTAQRREEVLEDVPMSVTVVSPETISKAGVNSLMDLGQIATGVQFNYSSAIQGVAIRGISTLPNGNNVEPNVAVYVDGFYDPNPLSLDTDVASVKNVEVLKGPQGTLYGRNATGGAVLINTLGPANTLTGTFDASYGRFNERIFNGFFAGPINDRIRYSLSGHYRASNGWIDLINPKTGREDGDAAPIRETAARGKLEIDLTDNLLATIGLNYIGSSDGIGDLFSVFGHVSPALPAPPARPVEFGTAAYNYQSFQYDIEKGATGKLVYKTPIGTLTSYSGYTHHTNGTAFDIDGTYADLSYTKIRFGEDTYQEAVDYTITAIDKLDLTVGGLYYQDVTAERNPDALGGLISYGPKLAIVAATDFRQTTEAWALYADGTYHLSDKLSLNAGGRYSDDYKQMEFDAKSPAGAYTVGPLTDHHTWTKFTPRVTVRYELAPRTDVYASWSEGFRSGTYNGSGPPAGVPLKPVNPENVDAYEIGFKTGRPSFQYQSAVFYYDYRDLQAQATISNPNCPAGVTCNTVNEFLSAPGAHIYGWDNEIIVNPVEHLTVRAGIEWLHARYTEFPNATGTGVNAANTLNVLNQVQNWSGKQMARAPNVSGNLSGSYEIPVSYGSFTLSASVNFTSAYAISNPSLYGPLAPVALQGEERFLQNSYALVGAQAMWKDRSGRYSLTAFGSNLSNASYRVTYNGNAFGDYSAKAEPVSYGVRIGVKF